jgi:hypothetical protein
VSVAAAASVNTNVSAASNKIIVGGTIIDLPATNVATMPAANINTGSGNYGGLAGAGQAGGGGTPIVVQIDGKAVASALQNSSLSGIGSFVDRVRN